MSDFSSFFSLLKLKTRHFCIAALLGLIVLFLPSSASDKFGLNVISDGWRFVIGIATLASIAGLIVNSIIWLNSAHAAKKAVKRKNATIIERLQSLSDEEGTLLQRCYDNKQQSITVHVLSPLHPYALALCNKGLLAQSYGAAGNYITPTNDVPYTIPDFVWNSPEFFIIFSGVENNESQ